MRASDERYELANTDEQYWSRCFAELLPILQLTTEAAVGYALHQLVAESEERAHSVTCALLHGMLHEPQRLGQHFGLLCCCCRDGFQCALAELQNLALWRYHRLSEGNKQQLLAVLSKLIETRAAGVESLVLSLLRQVGTGDCSRANLWLGDNLLSLLIHHRAWLLDATVSIVPAALLGFLRLAADHPTSTMRERRERELHFCQGLWSTRQSACLTLGRDLLLALHPFRETATMARVWNECAQLALWSSPARSCDLLTRVTPRAERCLHFMLTSLNVGEQRRHLQWFAERHLDQRSAGAVQDMLRWLCVCEVPSASMHVSAPFPRWMLAGWLLERVSLTHAQPRSAPASALHTSMLEQSQRVQWALLLDVLGFAVGETLAHIEPAITLLIHCVDRSMQSQPQLASLLVQVLLDAPAAIATSRSQDALASISKAMHAFSCSGQVALSEL